MDLADLRRALYAMRSTLPGRTLLTSGRNTAHMVDTAGDRPTDAVDGQIVHVRGDQSYIWNAASGSAGAWEAM